MKLHAHPALLITAEIANGDGLCSQQHEEIERTLNRWDQIANEMLNCESGRVTSHLADAGVLLAVCTESSSALTFATTIMQAVAKDGAASDISLRLAVHATESADGTLGRAADMRYTNLLRRAAHPGQILVSSRAQRTIQDTGTFALRDLGTHQMADLQEPEHVFQLMAPGLPHAFPAIRSLNGVRNNLPTSLTRFIGRDDDLAAVREQLASHRMLSLIGASGIGKSRLALQCAAEMLYQSADEMADGAWYIEFPLLPDPSLVVPSIAAALKITEDPTVSLLEAIVGALQNKKLLLVLDNCELVRRASAGAIDTILKRCAGIRVLASTVEGIGVDGEATYVVRPLTLPSVDPVNGASVAQMIRASEAGELFCDTVSSANPEFLLSQANSKSVVRLLSATAGIPLAVILVARGVDALEVDQTAGGVESGVRSTSTGPFSTHHAVVQGVIEWRFERLDAQLQSVLCRLSVMTGPWTQAAMLAAAHRSEVSEQLSDPAATLNTLVATGLITAKQQNGVVRYRLPNPVREFAAGRLDPAERIDARKRYAEYYLKMAEEAGSDLEGTDAARMALWLEKEYPNLCAALSWCQEDRQQAATGLQLARSLRRFWEVRGYPAEGQALLLSAAVWGERGNRTTQRADSLKRAGDAAFQNGNLDAARTRYLEALSISRELKDKARQAINLNSLGSIARSEGDHRAAQRMHEQALAINREIGDQRREAVNLHNLGNAHRDQGAVSEARDRYVEAIAISLKLGDRMGIGHNLNSLARLAYARDDRAEALRLYEEALTHFRAAGSEPWVAHNLGEIVKLNLRPNPIWTREAASA